MKSVFAFYLKFGDMLSDFIMTYFLSKNHFISFNLKYKCHSSSHHCLNASDIKFLYDRSIIDASDLFRSKVSFYFSISGFTSSFTVSLLLKTCGHKCHSGVFWDYQKTFSFWESFHFSQLERQICPRKLSFCDCFTHKQLLALLLAITKSIFVFPLRLYQALLWFPYILKTEY